jgi:hypothetical protein
MYWMRLSFSATLTSTTSLKYIGHKFSSDETVYGFYPMLSNASLKTAFGAGAAKTNWDEQHYVASKQLIDDLRSRKMAFSADQILDPWEFEIIGSYKAAELIFSGLGSAYTDLAKDAGAKYSKAFNLKFKNANIDASADGNLSVAERHHEFGRLVR